MPMIRNTRYTIMLHRRYSILFTLLMTCLSVMGQVRDIVIKDGAYYSTASLPVDTVHNQSFEKDSIYLIVPRDAQIAYPDYNHRAQLIVWQSGRPIYALPITQYDSLSYVRMLQGDTLRTIFSQQAGSLPSYSKRPIVWQHGQVTVTDSAQVLANDIYQSMAQGNYANFIVQPTEIVRDTQYILCIRDTVYKVQDIYDDTDDVDSIPSVDTIPLYLSTPLPLLSTPIKVGTEVILCLVISSSLASSVTSIRLTADTRTSTSVSTQSERESLVSKYAGGCICLILRYITMRGWANLPTLV